MTTPTHIRIAGGEGVAGGQFPQKLAGNGLRAVDDGNPVTGDDSQDCLIAVLVDQLVSVAVDGPAFGDQFRQHVVGFTDPSPQLEFLGVGHQRGGDVFAGGDFALPEIAILDVNQQVRDGRLVKIFPAYDTAGPVHIQNDLQIGKFPVQSRQILLGGDMVIQYGDGAGVAADGQHLLPFGGEVQKVKVASLPLGERVAMTNRDVFGANLFPDGEIHPGGKSGAKTIQAAAAMVDNQRCLGDIRFHILLPLADRVGAAPPEHFRQVGISMKTDTDVAWRSDFDQGGDTVSTQTLNLTEALHRYLLSVSLREHDLLGKLREETGRMANSNLQISPEQGQLMALLARLLGARCYLEIGVFTGYSSLCMALAMPAEARITACDLSEEYTAVARRYWQQAGVADRVDLRLGDALQTLESLIGEGRSGTYDMAFIDADKANYLAYYERCLALVRPGGLITVDNTLWSGRPIDSGDRSEDTEAIRAFNKRLHQDARVDLSLVPIGDGLTLARKREQNSSEV